jgi:hypothetical protein
MLEEISQYLVQAPLAVIVLAYIFFSDRQKTKIIKSVMEQNAELIRQLGEIKKGG